MTSSKVIYISGQRGPFSFLLDRGFVISRTLDVYLCGRDSPPPFYRLGKRWTTKNFDRPRSRNKITTNRNRRPSLLKREREWMAQRAITLTNFEPRFLFSCKYIISTIKLRRSKGNRNRWPSLLKRERERKMKVKLRGLKGNGNQ